MSSKFNQSRRRKPPGICRAPMPEPLEPVPPDQELPTGDPAQVRGNLVPPATELTISYTVDLPNQLPFPLTGSATITTLKKLPNEKEWNHFPPIGAAFPAAIITVKRKEFTDDWSINITGVPSGPLFQFFYSTAPVPRNWPRNVIELIITTPPGPDTCTIHSITARTTD